ncbi:MAG: PBSX family phage terminase large subunit [Bacteroidales bacterium]|nr:PBSX family phage terminase large subunit [Bacteroidales bacterium]
MEFVLNYKKFNPLGFWLLKLMQDESRRFIILWGGSSSGKSYSEAQVVLLMTLFDNENTLVYRKVGATIKDTIYEDFKVASVQLGIASMFEFKERRIVCVPNGARIDFKGLDDSEKIKGISNYKRVCMEEMSEFDLADFKQIRKRLRGKKGQQIIATFNPIKETHWIKKDVFDKETWNDLPMEIELYGNALPLELCKVKSIRENATKYVLNPRTGEMDEHKPNMVIIQTTYLNNFWVVGSPDGRYGFYDSQCIADFEYDRINDPDYYNVYALGEWGVIRTGSEFFASFNRGRHCKKCEYNPDLPIHISVDNNRLPYISITYWQVDTSDGTRIYQIGETCAGSPDNSARKAAKLVAKRLNGWNPEKIFLHGDATTRAGNTIDDEGRSFLDLFISSLKEEGIEVTDCVGKRNPSVPMSGEFINAIFEGVFEDISIFIDEECAVSIEDYLSVQKDANGAILKTKVKNKITGQTYEEHGHLSDTFRYVICDVLREQFLAFSNRRKRNLYAKDGAINFYNPDTECAYTNEVVYAMPNIAGKFCMVHGRQCGDRWHIVGLRFRETSSTEEIKTLLQETGSPRTILECPATYYPFARDLRKSIPNVRVMEESGDIDRRIAATSDYVRGNILFDERSFEDEEEYSAFVTNLLDYNKEGDSKEASAVLSGFIRFVVKSFSSQNLS